MAQSNQINKATNTILALLRSMVDFAPTLIQIAMPREDVSITPIQTYVTNTRFGHVALYRILNIPFYYFLYSILYILIKVHMMVVFTTSLLW